MSTIQADTKVRYKADPATAGWVIDISGENARVFIDGSTKLVPLAELEPAPGLAEMSPDRAQGRPHPAQTGASPHRSTSLI